MLPDRQNAKRCTLMFSETTSRCFSMLLRLWNRIQESPEECITVFRKQQNRTIRYSTCWRNWENWPCPNGYTGTQHTNSCTPYKWLYNFQPKWYHSINYWTPTFPYLYSSILTSIQSGRYLYAHDYFQAICFWFYLIEHALLPNLPVQVFHQWVQDVSC